MPSFHHPASVLCVLLCISMALQRSDLHLVYVTDNSSLYYSCTQPCRTSALTDCRCKDAQSHPFSILRIKRLTVMFTSPQNAAHLLNNSEVRYLTLINCGSRETPAFSLEGHFAVKHLERLTVINQPHRLLLRHPDSNRAKTTGSNPKLDPVNTAHLDTKCYEREQDTINLTTNKESMSEPSAQNIFLDRELGADYYEQARLGIIHSSVLEWGAMVKAYTVQTHINSNGVLPFPKLHLRKLPETPVIYVTFVY